MRGLNEFDIAYSRALRTILDKPPALNQRTGKKCRAIHGLHFHLHDTPLLTLRDIKPLWACAEAVWFLSGSDDASWMASFGFRTWEKFADGDGRVRSATGWRWRAAFNVDQVGNILSKLSADPSNRQAVLLSWDPALDAERPGPNAPCVMVWHVHLLDGRLHMSVLQRSGDMYFGVPHDVFGSRLVQELLAAGLGAAPGELSYLVSNAHLYEDQWGPAEEMLARADESNGAVGLPVDLDLSRKHLDRALSGDKFLVWEMSDTIRRAYDPWPAIAGPRLVL
jgi:thymidylate synthase